MIPADTETIQTSAFEGIAAVSVEIPEKCTFIGDYAFKNCANLTGIRIPENCLLGTDVFAECPKVYVFDKSGSDAERYCSEHANCVFVAEAQE